MTRVTQLLLLLSIFLGAAAFYVQYRLFMTGKITLRPVVQGLIALGIAAGTFMGISLLLAST